MKLIKLWGLPAVLFPPLEETGDSAEFYLTINVASQYSKGCPNEIILKRYGKVVHMETVPSTRSTYGVINRIFTLPIVYWRFASMISRTVRRWPEAREATFLTHIWTLALIGLWLRRMGHVRKVIYWIGDYYPNQGSWDWRVINFIARHVGRYIVAHADEVWYPTNRIYDLHVSRRGDRLTKAPEVLCPPVFTAWPQVHGMWNSSRLHRFVYVGHVRHGQGLEAILPAVAQIAGLHKDTFLDVIGSGPDIADFETMATKMGIAGRIRFHGFVSDENSLHEIIGSAAAGFSLYDEKLVPHAGYTVNSKVFTYIGCGTPVLVNDAGASYSYVLNGKAGLQVNYNAESVAKGMLAITSSPKSHLQYRMAARKLASEFPKEAERFRRIVVEGCK